MRLVQSALPVFLKALICSLGSHAFLKLRPLPKVLFQSLNRPFLDKFACVWNRIKKICATLRSINACFPLTPELGLVLLPHLPKRWK